MAGCVVVLAIVVVGQLAAAGGVDVTDEGRRETEWTRGSIPDDARLDARRPESPLRAVAAIPEHLSITVYEGPQTCVACHQVEAEAMHGSVHYQQAGPTPNVLNIPDLAGERGTGDIGFNTYCGAHVTSRRATCGNCHVGNGQFPSTQMTQAQLENIDCMMCHQDAYKRKAAPPYEDVPAKGPNGEFITIQAPIEDANGFHYMPDEDLMTISILEAARSVHLPTRASCLRCHAGAGGADGAKRGDVSSALIDPAPSIDHHMAPTGANLTCADCHSAGGHRVLGRGLDLRPNDVAERLTCETCHGERPHNDYNPNDGKTKDTHAEKVACQSCHIPTFGNGISTEIDRDWTQPVYSASACNGQGGWKPEEIHASDLVPSYRWFDGRSRVYVLGESPALNAGGEYAFGVPSGGVESLAAKLNPMKEHRGNAARHDATGQMIPHSTGTFFRFGDFDMAVQEGMAQSGLTGGYSLVPVHTYQAINHGVVNHDLALQCGDCHAHPGYPGGPPRIDPVADLGYGLNQPQSTLCAACHEPEPPMSFQAMHDKHVKDRFYDCSTCHQFSRPDRGLDFPFGVNDEVTLSLERTRAGIEVSWSPATRAIAYDMVSGSLTELRASGDFGSATQLCVADDSRFLSLVDPTDGALEEPLWYLIRPVFASGPGTYNSGGPAQHLSRDGGVGPTCP
jgi:hypothetical protein